MLLQIQLHVWRVHLETDTSVLSTGSSSSGFRESCVYLYKWLSFTVTSCHQTVWVLYTALDQVVLHSLGSLLGKRLVVLFRTNVVSVTFDQQYVVRVFLKRYHNAVKQLTVTVLYASLVEFKFNFLFDQFLRAGIQLRATFSFGSTCRVRAKVFVIRNTITVRVNWATIGAYLNTRWRVRALIVFIWNTVTVAVWATLCGSSTWLIWALVIFVSYTVTVAVRATTQVSYASLSRALILVIRNTVAVSIDWATVFVNLYAGWSVWALVSSIRHTVSVCVFAFAKVKAKADVVLQEAVVDVRLDVVVFVVAGEVCSGLNEQAHRVRESETDTGTTKSCTCYEVFVISTCWRNTFRSYEVSTTTNCQVWTDESIFFQDVAIHFQSQAEHCHAEFGVHGRSESAEFGVTIAQVQTSV